MGSAPVIDLAETPHSPAPSQPRAATSRFSVICVGICTVKRPRMLERCIRSVMAQEGVAGHDVRIVVVENDATPACKTIVEACAAASPFPILYIHEPRRGIPMARNRVLAAALAIDAERVVFLDDDQVAHPAFLAKHLDAARRDGVDVVQPHIVPIFPDPPPFWATGETGIVEVVENDAPLSGRLRPSAGTCGVMFSARLIRDDGMALRFDERLALAGGEDGDFFGRARALGAVIALSRLPVVMDEVHRSRLTYKRYIARGLAHGGQKFAHYRATKGFAAALRKHGIAAVPRLLRGLGQFIVAPLFAPFDMRRFKFTALEGGRNIAFAAGVLGAMLSLQYEYYREIDGY
ncbi:glycosyltransferase [Rhodomicrobium sp. Az07]|uniref:glycosyltransferase n=1 Tax=Rhodomicrobium sp. Az07 TaxID=2839034 RepID=UPI001BEB248F|nr:glycosyltransferase [Rhodomicrobium sp. Az07]MBT3069283.1 glycosyltransferase [Rhodomicrobium sp. Az07]